MTEKIEIPTLRAGNTVASLKPTEVAVNTVCIDCGVPTKPGTGSARCPQCWQDRVGTGDPNTAPQPSLNSPDIDECAPVLNAGPDLGWHDSSDLDKFVEKIPNTLQEAFAAYEAARAAQIPEEIPPTNLWSLRWRINELEKRVDELCDRIARHNVNSAWKI